MSMNYNKLWKIMIDRRLRKTDLIKMAGISTNAMAKMGKGGDVSLKFSGRYVWRLTVELKTLSRYLCYSPFYCIFVVILLSYGGR